MEHQAHVRAATSLINAVNALLFWFGHLSKPLPTPTQLHSPVYTEFYHVMFQINRILSMFSTILPRSTGLMQIKSRPPTPPWDPEAPEATTPVAPLTPPCPRPPRDAAGPVLGAPEAPVAPPPQPCPRPPRDAAGQATQAPEGFPRPPTPYPCPPTPVNRRKDYIPRKLE